jgi:phosphoribosylformylglycinamidine synthase
MVMADTVERPGGDAAVVRVHGSGKGLALACDCTPRYCAADPVEGGRQAVAEAWRNLTATGATPLAVTDNMNFGNPERPEVMGQFVGCIQGISEACRALDFPVVSGNVSFYNETNGRAILPTPAIGAVGLIRNLKQRATVAFKRSGEAIVLVGAVRGHLGASIFAREILGIEAGPPPPVDLAAERRNGDFVRAEIGRGAVSACHDVSDGGLLVAVAEMALAGDIGADVIVPGGGDPVSWLFGEDQARYVLTAADEPGLLERAAKAGIPAVSIGRTGGRSLTVNGRDSISVAELRSAHEGWLPGYMAGSPGA